MIKYGAPMKIYIVRKKKETEVQVEDTIEIQIEMVIDKVFEFVEDARNYILLPEDNKPPQKLNLSHITEENLLYENYSDFEIIEQELLPKQPNPEMKWKFSYKVFEINHGEENPFSLISEILDDHEFINEDEAKIAAGNILLNNLEKYTILSPHYTPEIADDEDGATGDDDTTGEGESGDSETDAETGDTTGDDSSITEPISEPPATDGDDPATDDPTDEEPEEPKEPITKPITKPLPNPPSWSPPWSEITGENDTKIFHGNVYVIYNLTKEQMFQFKVFQK
jgi:hypothetical protein